MLLQLLLYDLCNRCQFEMLMCPSCKTAHICFLPGASGTMPDHVIEEPPALPDFGVDSSVLLAPHDPPTYKAEHEIEVQHCHSNGNKMYCHMYMCEHHHIKPTSTVLEFLKQKIRYASQSPGTREACGHHGIASPGSEYYDTQKKDASR